MVRMISKTNCSDTMWNLNWVVISSKKNVIVLHVLSCTKVHQFFTESGDCVWTKYIPTFCLGCSPTCHSLSRRAKDIWMVPAQDCLAHFAHALQQLLTSFCQLLVGLLVLEVWEGLLWSILHKSSRCEKILRKTNYVIIIIIIKICSAHISTLLGAQGAETEKTWIQTIYNDSKNNIMCRDTCTMQLQIDNRQWNDCLSKHPCLTWLQMKNVGELNTCQPYQLAQKMMMNLCTATCMKHELCT